MAVLFNNIEYGTGWGLEEADPIHTLMKERNERSALEDNEFFSEINTLVNFKGLENEMEKLCRSQFQFDDGWCFHISEKLLYGEALVFNQGNVGTCVGAGGSLALAAKASQEILNEGDIEEPYGWGLKESLPFIGFHYGAGRCKNLWDGEKFRGSMNQGDGSYCSVQVWAYKTVGVLPCSLVQSNSSPYPQSSDVRDWGNNKRDLLNNHLKYAAPFLMKNSVTVKSADDIKNTVCVLKQPCHICSNWGFKSKGIDSKYGIELYRPSGNWAHNMTIYGVIAIAGQWFVIVKNSWGASAHNSPGRGLPPGCFVITIEDFARWIVQAECMSIGELILPKEEDNVFVRASREAAVYPTAS